MTDTEKKQFVEEQMDAYWEFVSKAVALGHERSLERDHPSMDAVPESLKEFTETFMQQLAFLLRLL